MKTPLANYSTFINENMFTQNCNFIFVPVDKDFKSLIPDITKSNTPFPSEMNMGTNIAGFLLVPAFLDTREIMNSPWMKSHDDTPDIKGYYSLTSDPRKDGPILMNLSDPSSVSSGAFSGIATTYKGNLSGTEKKVAMVPGFQQHYGFYFKSGSAWVLEKLMLDEGWEPEKMSDVTDRKVANGFPDNKTISKYFWEGLDGTIKSLKELFGACSSSFGFVLSGETEDKYKNKVSDLLLDLFKTNPGYFMALNIDKGISEQVMERAKETEGEDITDTIDNLSALKDSGFFDD